MTAMITEIFYPLLLSYGMAFLASAVLQGRWDAASVTSLTAVFTILAAGVCYRQECRKRKEERLKWWQEKPMPLWSWFALAAAGVLGNVVFSFLLSFLQLMLGLSNAVQEELLSGKSMWIQAAGLGIAVPVAEELIFRGLTYGNMRKYLGVWPSAVLGGALFAVYHGNVMQMLYAFPMGVILCLVYEKCKTIKAPIVLHCAANLSTILWRVIV